MIRYREVKVIGLTGGIGTGKSTVSEYLRQYNNVDIIDADEMSRGMTDKGSQAFEKIKLEFGNSVIDSTGELNRRKLAEIVFSDKKKLIALEDIITAEVVKTIDILIKEAKSKCDEMADDVLLLFIDAPLLFEKDIDTLCEETWLVVCDLETRIKRVKCRDNTTRKEILDRINNQMSDEEKKKRADFVIDNSKGMKELYKQIDDLMKGCYEKS